MSDDTPTQRFDAAGDAPTERFGAAGDAPTQRPAAPAEDVAGERKSRRLVIILAIVGGVLLLAVLIVLILLLTKGGATTVALPTSSASPPASASPSPAPTKSATPTPTPTPTTTPTQPPPPPSTAVEITGFSAGLTSKCSSQTKNPVYMQIAWSSDNGIAAYFGVDTTDAQSGGMGWTLPPSGNENDFPNGYVPYEYQCGNASQTYTITIVGTDGSKQSKTVKVVNDGDVY